jgi:hypothetical protein
MERHFRTIPVHDARVTNWRKMKSCFSGADAAAFLLEYLHSRPEERFQKAERSQAEKIAQKLLEQGTFAGVNGYANFIDSERTFYRFAALQADDGEDASPSAASEASPKRVHKRTAVDSEDLEGDSPSSKKSSLLKRGTSLRGSISRGMNLLKNSTLRRGKRIDRAHAHNFGVPQPREFPTPLRNILNSNEAARSPERSPMEAWCKARGAFMHA